MRNYLAIDINFGWNETGAQAYRKVKAAKSNDAIIIIQVMLGQCLLVQTQIVAEYWTSLWSCAILVFDKIVHLFSHIRPTNRGFSHNLKMFFHGLVVAWIIKF